MVPDYWCDSILELDVILRATSQIKGIIFDIDQTILPYGESVVNKEILGKLRKINQQYMCCILSNYPNTVKKVIRIKFIEKQTGLVQIKNKSKKPDPKAFEEAVNYLGLGKSEIAIVGDRVLTDIMGGNNFGITTVLVKPLDSNYDPFIMVTIPRIIENVILKILITIKKWVRKWKKLVSHFKS